MQISQEAIDALKSGVIKDNIFFLNCGQLERSLYEEVDTILSNLGAEWKSKENGHVIKKEDFESSLTSACESAFYINLKKDFDYFPTPDEVADKILKLAFINGDCDVLEPSAGTGNLIKDLNEYKSLTCCELIKSNFDKLNNLLLIKQNAFAYNSDFLSTNFEKRFDRIIMNPPFGKANSLAIKHFDKAFKHLNDKGVIVGVFSSSIRRNTKFMNKYQQYKCVLIDMRKDAFAKSGTLASTSLFVVYNQVKKTNSEYFEVIYRNLYNDDIVDIYDKFDSISDAASRAPKDCELDLELTLSTYFNPFVVNKYIVELSSERDIYFCDVKDIVEVFESKIKEYTDMGY